MKINTPQQMGYIWHWWFSYSPENVVLVRCGSTVATYLTAGPYKVVLWVCFGKQTHSDSNWSVQAKCGTKKTTDVGHIWTKQSESAPIKAKYGLNEWIESGPKWSKIRCAWDLQDELKWANQTRQRRETEAYAVGRWGRVDSANSQMWKRGCRGRGRMLKAWGQEKKRLLTS